MMLRVGGSVRAILVALPFVCAACAAPPVTPGSVLLSNPGLGLTAVEAVLPTSPVCAAYGPGVIARQRFTLPDGATRFIEAPSGADVCWRRRLAGPQGAAPWSNWNITYTFPGRSIDSNL
jgi:hypothetical protein